MAPGFPASCATGASTASTRAAEPLELVLGELERCEREQLVELLDAPRRGDRRDHGRLRQQPGERDRGRRRAMRGGDLVERREHLEAAIVEPGERSLRARAVD